MTYNHLKLWCSIIRDPKLIAEKLIFCFDVFVLKNREKFYTDIEQQPNKTREIKKNLILSNVYSMRMNVDIAFKRQMYKMLAKNLEENFTKENLKNLLVSIIDELERPSERFLDVFAKKQTKKIQISTDPIDDYLQLILSGMPIEKLRNYYEGKGRSESFLKKLLESTEKGTSLHRALEDLVEEYETGVFFPRYFKTGEIKNYIAYHFNYYSILLLEHRLKNLERGLKLSLTLLNLIPEYYYNENKITDLLFEVLNELFEFKIPLSKAKISVLTIHFISVLCAILFENLIYEDKLKLLQMNYEFTLNQENIESIAKQLDEFIDKSPSNILLKEVKFEPTDKLNLNRPNKYLFQQASFLFNLNLHPFSILIYKYLKENTTNIFAKTIMNDNIATGLREMGEYKKAIKIYETLKEYYEKNKMFYRLFLIEKNIAYCYYQDGSKQKSDEILNKFEANFSLYNKSEKVRVYYNLAVRYRFTNRFDFEEKYLNLASEIVEINNPLYFEIQKRSLELGSYFDYSKGKLDFIALKKLESDRIRNNNMEYAYTFLNNNQLNLSRYYLEGAYEIAKRDIEYWKVRSNINILEENWEDLKETSEEVLKFDSNDPFGNLYHCLHFISKKSFLYILKQLLKLQSDINLLQVPNPMAFVSILRALHFIIRSFSKEEIKEFVDFMFEQKGQNIIKCEKLLLIIAKFLADNREKELSGYIYKKFLDLHNSEEGNALYAGWCYQFNDFKNAEHFYKKALAFSPNKINLLEHLARVGFILNEFKKSLMYLDKMIKIVKGKTKDYFVELKNFIILVKDSKLRFENLPFRDVKTIFNTVEHQLKILNPNEDIEFGTVLTGLSKGLETLLAHTLGKYIYDYVEGKHFPLPKRYKQGTNKNVKELHVLLRNFFEDPANHHPTLGNWKYILRGILNGSDPQNPLMEDIYDFVKNSLYFDEIKLKLIIKTEDLFVEDRNLGTHKRIYSKKEVVNILKQLIPLFNEIISFLHDKWEELNVIV